VISVVIPVSPIKSHPQTHILEETIDSVRHHLPDAEILLCFDGIRAEQIDRKPDYDEHIRRMLWLADHKYGNIAPFLFDQHMHQTGMMRAVLDEIRTPLLIYVEQDTPLTLDHINFGKITEYIESGESNLVRLHHEAVIPSEHYHMIHSGHDEPFIRTSQWSQRPHVSSVAFYRRVMDYFTSDAKSFIEDKMHGVVDEAVKRHRMIGWNQFRIHLYNPGGGNLKRSLHLDGRAGEPKLDETQVF
jgi:hypothetical protein